MAFGSTGGSDQGPMSDINVTPLVDVMLVLLVIFMVTVPALVGGVRVDLPKTREATPAAAKDAIIVSVTRGGEVFLGRESIRPDGLAAHIRTRMGKSPGLDPTVYLRADQRTPYGEVVKLMAMLRANGISRLSLITEPEQLEGPPR
ncbi:MAG: biopolymer transporter ExbD [Deltaproteobacteria bacterium]|nr:biopolymer transporter ExbD [Deltaproteobacteria bacterium]